MYYRARMFDTGLGRFVGRDANPQETEVKADRLNYDGNPNSADGYQNGYNFYAAVFVPFRLDPSGYDVTDTPSAEFDYHDELSRVGDIVNKDRDSPLKGEIPEASEFYQNLKDLKGRDCPKLQTHYVNGGTKDFANHAKNNKECTISVFIGHGFGDNKSADEGEVKGVKDALGGSTGKGCKRPRYGINSCFGGTFNDAISPDNRITNPSNNKKPIRGTNLNEDFNQRFPSLKKDLEEMCKCCNGKVILHLYFGAIGKAKVKKPNSPKRDFSTW